MPRRTGGCLVALALSWILPASDARGAPFVRGDTDASGGLDITDSVRILGFLFLGSPAALACADAADADDSGSLELTDGVFGLNFLFSGSRPPPSPFPGCGNDPTPDGLPCDSFPPCGCEEAVPGPLSTVNGPESHGLRLVGGPDGRLIAFYHQTGNVYAHRLTGAGIPLGERVLIAAGVVDFDVAASGATAAFVWLNAGRVFGMLLSTADLSVVTPETLILNPGAATDRVRINYDEARASVIVVYEIGSTLSASSAPTPALRPASTARILSIGVSRKFDVPDTGSPAYAFYTLDSDGLLRGVRLNADGSRDGQTVTLTSGAGVDAEPAVARAGATLGLVYAHLEPGADRLRFVLLDANLAPLRGPIDLPEVTTTIFQVLEPPGVDVPTDVAYLGEDRFLVSALRIQTLGRSHWHAHEVSQAGNNVGLTVRRLVPEPCAHNPCLQVYSSVAVGVNGESVLLGSTRDGDEGSARVATLVCP
jgi:hypothetical protein